MVVKVYISGISGNKEVKKRQQRVLLILDSKNVKYEVIDIAEPGAEEAKDFMQTNSTQMGNTIGDPNPRHPLPPQIFNDDVYCGDYDSFDMANEVDEMEKFLKLEPDDSAPTVTTNAEIKLGNSDAASEEIESTKNDDSLKPEEKVGDSEVPENERTPETNVEEIQPESKDEETKPDSKDDEAKPNSKDEDETSNQKIENETDDQKVENGNKQEPSDDKKDEATEKSDEA